ncbi:MAG: hypothetical protein GWN01_03615 [Nitrosopumilaceae archaeon]|nr:hypothetical protein [Nitrosopumilaceae archaeon]NIU00046.1 hypothetical protein [Nitrosopumilaceae archaeon]NIU86425.1 hypothetical protein [Nitrosopumilaceae archaeon]NIV65134.1 hypothetical protein [Nitrosopumilaceae archaeon]NIX60648.1 hypothetical protein [Nitrosopumilaceae archaeon]
MKRKGISEIISAILVIAIVVAGMGVYTIASQQRILGDSLSLKETIEQSQDRTSELLEQVEMIRTVNSGKDFVSIFLFNYGTKNVTVSSVFVNGTQNMTDSSGTDFFHVRTLDKLNQTAIPVGKSVELIVNFTNTNAPENIDTVLLVTDTDKFIEIKNKTSN